MATTDDYRISNRDSRTWNCLSSCTLSTEYAVPRQHPGLNVWERFWADGSTGTGSPIDKHTACQWQLNRLYIWSSAHTSVQNSKPEIRRSYKAGGKTRWDLCSIPLRDLAKNVHVRLYLGFDRNGLHIGGPDAKHNGS